MRTGKTTASQIIIGSAYAVIIHAANVLRLAVNVLDVERTWRKDIFKDGINRNSITLRTMDKTENKESFHEEQKRPLIKIMKEEEKDPLDKFMDEEIAYLKSCNPANQWGEIKNKFAAGMIHAYERIKAERDFIGYREFIKQQNFQNNGQ